MTLFLSLRVTVSHDVIILHSLPIGDCCIYKKRKKERERECQENIPWRGIRLSRATMFQGRLFAFHRVYSLNFSTQHTQTHIIIYTTRYILVWKCRRNEHVISILHPHRCKCRPNILVFVWNTKIVNCKWVARTRFDEDEKNIVKGGKTYHFKGLLGSEQVEHGLEMLLYVASRCRDTTGRSCSFVWWQYECCSFSSKVAFAQAEKKSTSTKIFTIIEKNDKKMNRLNRTAGY